MEELGERTLLDTNLLPAASFRTDNWDDAKNVEVFSFSGQRILVQQITPTQSNVEVNISSLTKGLYLVRLISNDSNFVAKLIVD